MQHTQERCYIIVQIITYKSKELKYSYSFKVVLAGLIYSLSLSFLATF